MTRGDPVHDSAKRANLVVPVLDFSELSDPEKRSSVCARIGQACETVGFFQIVNSGIPLDVLENACDKSREFFALPDEEKCLCAPDLGDKKPIVGIFQLGYKKFPLLGGVSNLMEELVYRHYHGRSDYENDKDSYHTGSPLTGDVDPTQNWWPSDPVDHTKAVKRLSEELGKLGDTLLDVFSESLGFSPTYLREEYHKNLTVPRYLSFHRYVKGFKREDEAEVGIIPHRDSSVFSIVCQSDIAGLDINPYGQWLPVKPVKGALVINVGDILQAWTNGRYRSILHRVMANKQKVRHSFAYFLYPAPGPEADYIVEPIPALLSEHNLPSYVPFSYLEFFNNKIKVNSVSMLKSHEIEAVAPARAAVKSHENGVLARSQQAIAV